MKNTFKPMFSTRMLFPILFPTFNEKIIIRVWDKRTGLSDIFIAHLPEKMKSNDWFNLNYL